MSPYIYSSSGLETSEILELPTPIVAIETKHLMTNSKFYGFPNTCPTVNVITSISAWNNIVFQIGMMNVY